MDELQIEKSTFIHSPHLIESCIPSLARISWGGTHIYQVLWGGVYTERCTDPPSCHVMPIMSNGTMENRAQGGRMWKWEFLYGQESETHISH